MARFGQAVKVGNLAQAESILASRLELIGMDMAESDEHRALHYAVLGRDVPMVRLLMRSRNILRPSAFAVTVCSAHT
jgi:hypothetical protein